MVLISKVPKSKKNIGWFDVTKISYNHRPEFQVAQKILICFNNINEPLIIVERNEDKYKPDLKVSHVNSGTLEKDFLCYIEVERKSVEFPEYPDPPKGWYAWSFLDRKVENPEFGEDDVYILGSWKYCENIFWTTFREIKKYCIRIVRVPGDRHEIYYRIKISDHSRNKKSGQNLLFDTTGILFDMNRGYESLTLYLSHLPKASELKNKG